METSTSAELLAQLNRVRSGQLDGLNVTTPWKQAAADACDRLLLCDEHGALHAVASNAPRTPVNTIFVRDGELCGTSTDGPGLGLALARHGQPVRNRRIGLIGAGGAGASIAHWLVAIGADVCWVTNRSPSAALALVEALRAIAPSSSAQAVPWQAADPMGDAELVVHASRVGHGLQGAEAEVARAQLAHLPWASWSQRATLVDVVYGAGPTVAERCAADAGCEWVDGGGLAMLACQAALSLGVWAGAKAPVDAMLAALAD